MEIVLLLTGKTDEKWIEDALNKYGKRIERYAKFSIEIITVPKAKGAAIPAVLKSTEANSLMKFLKESDYIILLDEKGGSFTSREFANHLQKRMNAGYKRIVFLVGGAFGFDDAVYKLADEKLALSKMTFSHQVIRVIFIEQLYRAFTILKNEPYHHD
jgi:23S rRNA (pseudouridine1915-N3)-methyltransferase